jgi:anti-anti-sigma factor
MTDNEIGGKAGTTHNRSVAHIEPVVAALRTLCHRASVDQDFSAVGEVTGDRVTVVVTGEVDMSTADAMFGAATPEGVRGATLDLTGVTFFDSAAIHALIRLNERYEGDIEVVTSPQVFRVLDISGLAEQPWVRNG